MLEPDKQVQDKNLKLFAPDQREKSIPLFLQLNDKCRELLSAYDAWGMPLGHTSHIHQSM